LLRVRVQEASTERLLLQIVERPGAGEAAAASTAPTPAPVPTVGVPLPSGGVARLLVDPDEGSDGDDPRAPRSVTLRYESAGLGRVDLALVLDGGVIRAAAHAPAGEVAERLRAASGDLRTALAAALGRPASVDIVARAQAVDVAA
jgi:hypothetical protein